MNVRQDVTVGSSGGAVIVTYVDASRGFAAMKQHMPSGMARDIDFSTRLLATPDTVTTELIVSQAATRMTLDTRASIGDMTEFDKMRDMVKQQLTGLQFMLGMMHHDSAQQHSPLEWLGKGGLLQTSWTPHEIKRTFNQALYDSLKRKGGGMIPGMGMDTAARYALVFHLPTPATRVDGEPYALSADRKTVTFDRKFIDIFGNPNLLSFTIDY
jgi:hypothetical protein